MTRAIALIALFAALAASIAHAGPDDQLVKLYKQIPKPMYTLWLNPPSDSSVLAKEINRGEHQAVRVALAETTGSVGMQFYQNVSNSEKAVAVCLAAGARLALRIDPFKGNPDPHDFGVAYSRRLAFIEEHARKWSVFSGHVGAVLINHETWEINSTNERAVRRKLDAVTAIIYRWMPDAHIIHYNFLQRRAFENAIFNKLPGNLSTDFRGCSLYFDRADQAFEVLDATSASFTYPTVPWICLTASFLFNDDGGAWWLSGKTWWRWPDNYPRGELYVSQLGTLLSESDSVVPFVVIYGPEYLSETFARRLKLLCSKMQGPERN